MSPGITSAIIFGIVFGAGLLATWVRNRVPQHHLSAETKDTVKLAMGLVGTMTALILGLLVASAKGSYDSQKNNVSTTAAKLITLDRAFEHYGPEGAKSRVLLKEVVESMMARLWPEQAQKAQLDPDTVAGGKLYEAVQTLSPQNEAQREIKSMAVQQAIALGESRWLLFEQSGSAISVPLLTVVVCWLAILFFSFGLFAPPNNTAIVALMISAVSVSGAIFLILELDRPFEGLIHIPKEPMEMVLVHIGK